MSVLLLSGTLERVLAVREKYTAMGGQLRFCALKEYPNSHRVIAPYPLTNTSDFAIPKNNPPPPSFTRNMRFTGYAKEVYKPTRKLSSTGFGIYYVIISLLSRRTSSDVRK